MYVWIWFWALYSIPLVNFSIPGLIVQCFNYCCFIVILDIWWSKLPHHILLQEIPGYSWAFTLPAGQDFKTQLEFWLNCIESVDYFRENWHFYDIKFLLCNNLKFTLTSLKPEITWLGPSSTQSVVMLSWFYFLNVSQIHFLSLFLWSLS